MVGGEINEAPSACDGLIDEVRISRGVRPVAALPDAPPAADAATVALWHLDAVKPDRETRDTSPLASPAWLTAGHSMDEINRLSFQAGPAPLDTPAQVVALEPGAAPHPTPVLASRPSNLTATRLVFDGVAIHCTVWLNGERLGEHDDMLTVAGDAGRLTI